MQLVIIGLMMATLVLLVAVPPVQSADTLHVFTGESNVNRFGYSVASAGDVNNDGFADLIVGAYMNDAGGADAGRAYVFSGINSDTLFVFTGEAAGDRFGLSVASAGDVNNDGYDDLIVGASRNNTIRTGAGRAYVFSGLDGDTLHIFTGESAFDQFGWSVSSVGDVNHDGYSDVIVGADNKNAFGLGVGRAYVFSGLTGETLYVFTGEVSGAALGVSVASAGDVNNDGYLDFIIGALRHDPGFEQSQAGRAYVYSGFNGDTLHVFTGDKSGVGIGFFGWSVASAGDVNNDGHSDLIVGASHHNAGGTWAGRAYVYSGLSGEKLYTFTGAAAHDNLGLSVASAGDFNNDGYDDLFVSAYMSDAGGSNSGRAYVFSGLSGDTLYLFDGEKRGDQFGSSVAPAGDVNNDGYTDLIVGATEMARRDSGPGLAYVFSGAPPCCIGNTGNTDCDPKSVVDIADLTVLIDHLFVNLQPLCCRTVGNIDGDANGEVTIADVTALIDHLFISLAPTAVCQ